MTAAPFRHILGAIIVRELRTLWRTRAYLALTIGVAVILLGLIQYTGSAAGGYVPAAVDLLLPLEILVPLIAIAFGYRAFTGENDDRAVLRTYPVRNSTFVLGVFIGRFVGLAAALVGPLVIVLGLIALTPGVSSTVFATAEGVDSPLLFIRFMVLTLVFGAAILSIVLAAAVLATSGRGALALAIGLLLLVIIGGDILLISGVAAGTVSDDLIPTLLALFPNSAYRGLVFELVIGTVVDETGYTNPVASVLGLVVWIGIGIGLTVLGVSRRGEAGRIRGIWRQLR